MVDRERWKIFLIFLAWLTFSVAAGAPPAFPEERRIVAVVNNEVITQADFDRALAPVYFQLQDQYSPEELAKKLPEIRRKTLDQLIEERLMLQEAKNPHPVEVSKGKVGIPPAIAVSEIEVDQMLDDMRKRFSNPDEFADALAQKGLTLEDLRNRYKEQLMVQKLIDRQIRSRIAVSPSEVTTYYNIHAHEFEVPAAVQAAVILVKTREQAEDLAKQIAQGADFYDLASRYSEGPNAKMGGRVGFVEKGKMVKEIDAALFSLKAGDISPIIRTPAGFHLFRIESLRSAHQMTLEEAQGKIQRILDQQKGADLYEEWIKRLKSNAYIQIKNT